MGGRAIAKLINQEEADRISLTQKSNYLAVLSDVKDLTSVREIYEKDSFGDIDFLYCGQEKIDFFINKFINSGHKYNGHVKNSNITSIALNDSHQIDIIRVSPETFRTSQDYFADNDKGNLIGVIFNRLGFIFGHEGLYLRLNFDKMLLTRDYSKALKFLKYPDYVIKKILDEGFQTYEEMFKTVILSPYFDDQYYKFENLNNENRVRNKKRKTYQKFVDFISNKPKTSLSFTKDKMMYDSLIFFEKEKEYLALLKKQEDNKLNRQLFNGDLVNSITGLVREDLGKFIQFIKIEEPFMTQHAYYYSPKEISEKITKTYQKFKDMK